MLHFFYHHHESMPELTERTGAGSGHWPDDFGAGNQASHTILNPGSLFFLLFKMKGPGTGVCLVCYTTQCIMQATERIIPKQ